MGIQINGQTDTISATDGGLVVSGQELTSVTNINATGIVTASSFSGDGSGLTGVGGTDKISEGNSSAEVIDTGSDGRFVVTTEGSERLRVTSAGLVGIGTTSPGGKLHASSGASSAVISSDADDLIVENSGNSGITIATPNSGTGSIRFADPQNNDSGGISYNHNDESLRFTAFSTERMRFDSSGRMLVGTATARSNVNSTTPTFQAETATTSASASAALSLINNQGTGGAPPALNLGLTRGTAVGGTTKVEGTDELGFINFLGSDGTNFIPGARIFCTVDGTSGANDMPGRLVFSTTADGASSPTERMRIRSDGHIGINKTNLALETTGTVLYAGGYIDATTADSSGGTVLTLNRQVSDGDLVYFRQAAALEGWISVSGTTVTYGGGHLARWSQLPNDENPSTLLKGTVLSNLDEMCEWGEEDNEQLNKTKVSDVEGDKNVAGVFVSVSPSEDGPLDFFFAMTGDMIIRIAEGITVERGDLLMSAGDGTAKPQGDDLVRSCTVAKVTSTNVSCTYEDGSYCVPCVVMAC